MLHVSLTREEFRRRCGEGNLIPVFRTVLGDTLTAISIFLKLGGPDVENSFLMESVVQGERLGRHTFLGVRARAILRGGGNHFRLTFADGREEKEHVGEPLSFLEERFRMLRPVTDDRLPPFHGGAVGFLAYDAIRYYEELPDNNPDPLDQEEAYFILCDELIILDHVKRDIRLVCNVRLDEFDSQDEAYDFALSSLDRMEEALQKPLEEKIAPPAEPGELQVTSNITDEQYRESVRRAREYIKAGDIFQVVLSRRFSFQADVHPFQIYRALRSINPSPYMFYVNAGPYRIVGSSPEILVRLVDRQVVIRPIAGTRPRGLTPQEDQRLEEELLADEKEVAEHIMLVDLGRNDAGRVSRPGSVRVTEFKVIERYSHVMHIVSNCVGELRDDLSPYEALRRALPAGTVSGAPKIRAMEIIDELETVRRGIYAGALGVFNYRGGYDTAITLRTLVFTGETGHLQAGAGIVYDSDPQKECEEVANKARGPLDAVRFARRWLR